MQQAVLVLKGYWTVQYEQMQGLRCPIVVLPQPSTSAKVFKQSILALEIKIDRRAA